MFWLCSIAHGPLVPQPAVQIQPVPPSWEAQNLNYWTTGKVQPLSFEDALTFCKNQKSHRNQPGEYFGWFSGQQWSVLKQDERMKWREGVSHVLACAQIEVPHKEHFASPSGRRQTSASWIPWAHIWRLLSYLSKLSSDPTPLWSPVTSSLLLEPLQPEEVAWKGWGTYWGTMVIWTKQMKRKTSEAHAT